MNADHKNLCLLSKIRDIKIENDDILKLEGIITSPPFNRELLASKIMEDCKVNFDEIEQLLQNFREQGFLYKYKENKSRTGTTFTVFPQEDFLGKYKKYKKQNNEALSSEKKDIKPEDEPVLYVITYINRKIIINNSYQLSAQDYDSENNNFFEYILKRPNEKITRKKYELESKLKLKKSFHSILNDIGFKNELRKVFFPNVSINTIEFRNSLTKRQLDIQGVNLKALKDQIKEIERNRKI